VGHYAGIATRLVAYVIDLTLVIGIYAFAVAGIAFVIGLVTRFEISFSVQLQVSATLSFVLWSLVYMWYTLATFDRTPGMALMGLRIARGDGSRLGVWRALARVVLLPMLSLVTLGLGELGVVFGRRRRALWDVVAGSVIVYDWEARPARAIMRMRRTTVDVGG
jgi:uncharacterized RDD family membrane protein YckC